MKALVIEDNDRLRKSLLDAVRIYNFVRLVRGGLNN